MTTNTNAASVAADIQYLKELAAHYSDSPVPEIRAHRERLLSIAAALASPGAVAVPSLTACAECNGAGEVFGHSDDCTDDLCALNGDIYSCEGKVEPCQCMDSAAAEAKMVTEPEQVHLAWRGALKACGVSEADRDAISDVVLSMLSAAPFREAEGAVAAEPTLTDAAPSALSKLTAALVADPEYAWSWHCNLAMPIMDSTKVSHRDANIAAARLMQHIFGIDTAKHVHFELSAEPETKVNSALADWAASRWHDEVANRPLVNIHRRSLDDTWRQVLRYAGVDDRVRLGPTHDELVAPPAPKE